LSNENPLRIVGFKDIFHSHSIVAQNTTSETLTVTVFPSAFF